MKTLLTIAIITLLGQGVVAQHKYTTKSGHISFFAKAPVADVDAQNEKVKIELNTKSGEVTFDMKMADFDFKSEKMEKDATDKYLETEKYTTASFKGEIDGKVSYDKPGSYEVVAIGKMMIHGVEKEIKEKGTITVSKNQVKLNAEFNLALEDFKIEQPQILGKKMTADKVFVKIAAVLSPDGGATALKKN